MSKAGVNLDRALWFASRAAPSGPRRRWRPDEVTRLENMVGKLRPAQMARRLGRTLHMVNCKLRALGYAIGKDVTAPLGVTAIGLARRLGVPYEVVWRAVRRGEIKSERDGRKDYLIRWPEARRYERIVRRRQQRRDRALARIAEETITKPEFERLLNLSETHSQRYLAGKIVRGWKIPVMWTDASQKRWEWRVSLADALCVKALREAGRLRLDTPAYRRMQARTNAEIVRLRRARRLGQRDDLGRPRSAIVPGCFTVAQIASHVGLSENQVYQHVQLGRLEATRRRVGKREFIAVRPEALPPYLEWTRRERLATGPLRPRGSAIQLVHAAGRMTLTEAAEKYRIPRARLSYAAQCRRFRSELIAGIRAVRTADVRYFARRYHGTTRRKSSGVANANA